MGTAEELTKLRILRAEESEYLYWGYGLPSTDRHPRQSTRKELTARPTVKAAMATLQPGEIEVRKRIVIGKH